MRLLSFFLIMVFCSSCKIQKTENLTFDTLSSDLITFLYKKKEINYERSEKLKSKEYSFNLRGLFNNKSKGELINGIYAFSSFNSHGRAYFVIVNNNDYTILDISTRKGLDTSIKNVLDFCEKERYCVDITNQCITSIISVYYKINKNPLNKIDVNCEHGIVNTDDLP